MPSARSSSSKQAASRLQVEGRRRALRGRLGRRRQARSARRRRRWQRLAVPQRRHARRRPSWRRRDSSCRRARPTSEKSPQGAARGIRSKVCVADWNGDGRLDLLVGDFTTQKPDRPSRPPRKRPSTTRSARSSPRSMETLPRAGQQGLRSEAGEDEGGGREGQEGDGRGQSADAGAALEAPAAITRTMDGSGYS